LNNNEFEYGGQWLNMAEQRGEIIFLIKSHFNSKADEEIVNLGLKVIIDGRVNIFRIR